MPANVDSKPLAESLNPLEATLTKNRGGGRVAWRKKDRSVIRDPPIPGHGAPTAGGGLWA